MREHEEIMDLLKIPYDFNEVDKSYFARKIKQYVSLAVANKDGFSLLTEKAFFYKQLLFLSAWLDEYITKFDLELSEKNVEIFFPKTQDMVITRSLANDEKATFVEPFTALESNRARQLLIGKGLPGRNLI